MKSEHLLHEHLEALQLEWLQSLWNLEEALVEIRKTQQDLQIRFRYLEKRVENLAQPPIK